MASVTSSSLNGTDGKPHLYKTNIARNEIKAGGKPSCIYGSLVSSSTERKGTKIARETRANQEIAAAKTQPTLNPYDNAGVTPIVIKEAQNKIPKTTVGSGMEVPLRYNRLLPAVLCETIIDITATGIEISNKNIGIDSPRY